MIKRTVGLAILLLLLCVVVSSLALASSPEIVGPVYDGPELDYQPSIIRVEPSGQLMLVYERMRLSDYYGDLYVTFSDDDGATWTIPQAIINSGLNERHPSLLQLDENSFVLFYLVDETGSNSFRIHRATSSDRLAWTDQGAIDLGWASPGEINPNVIRENDGTLTMTYHRYVYPGYSHIAQSHDDGATWDTLMTAVTDFDANLPRLAKRESDGTYIVTYQVGGSDLDLYAETSSDPYDWSGPQVPVSTDVNTHDSQPIVLEDGTFLVTYAKTPVNYFDLFYRTSLDGVTWLDEVQVTDDPGHYDTQPHPMLQGTPGHIVVAWSHQDSGSPYVDHDVWINTDLLVGPEATVHIGDIRMRSQDLGGGLYGVFGRVPVLDQDGQPVPGALVTAEWTKPNGRIQQQLARSRDNGAALYKLKTKQEGVYVLTVLDVQADGYAYDPDQNLETSEELTVP
jgi:hypothetical protein